MKQLITSPRELLVLSNTISCYSTSITPSTISPSCSRAIQTPTPIQKQAKAALRDPTITYPALRLGNLTRDNYKQNALDVSYPPTEFSICAKHDIYAMETSIGRQNSRIHTPNPLNRHVSKLPFENPVSSTSFVQQSRLNKPVILTV